MSLDAERKAMNQKKQEYKALVIGIVANTCMAAAGFWVFSVTRLTALFLDASFTLISVLTSFSAAIISKISKRRSPAFPHGQFMLEPLYGVFKSLLVLALLIYSIIATTGPALAYFRLGIGEKIMIGPVIPYEIFMVVMGMSLYAFYRKQNRRINNISTMLSAESKGTLVDSIMSGGIGVGALLISFISDDSPFSFLMYTGDWFITVLLALFSFREPLATLKTSFKELTYGEVTNRKIKETIHATVAKHLQETHRRKICEIHKVGTSFHVDIYLDDGITMIDMARLNRAMEDIKEELAGIYDDININIVAVSSKMEQHD